MCSPLLLVEWRKYVNISDVTNHPPPWEVTREVTAGHSRQWQTSDSLIIAASSWHATTKGILCVVVCSSLPGRYAHILHYKVAVWTHFRADYQNNQSCFSKGAHIMPLFVVLVFELLLFFHRGHQKRLGAHIQACVCVLITFSGCGGESYSTVEKLKQNCKSGTMWAPLGHSPLNNILDSSTTW